MGVFDLVLGKVALYALIVVSIGPILLFGMAADRLAEMGLPREIVGPIAAILMVVWAVAILVLFAKQIDWS